MNILIIKIIKKIYGRKSCLIFDESGFSEFFYLSRETLDQHALRKQVYTRGNHMLFINKTLSKECIKRSKLRNKVFKDRTD